MKKKKSNLTALKNTLLERAKEKGACSDQYRRAANAETEEELLQVIYDNLRWCSDHMIINDEYLSGFDQEVLLKSGVANTGKENSGLANSGDWNSGDCNSGDCNSGYRNSGYRNSGYRNSGDCNSGYRNSGDRNSGDWNSGDCNSGDCNSGNWNSGDRNSGDCNSGYRNSGAFCLDPNPKVWLFDKPTDIPVREWEQSRACQILYSLDPTIWVPSSVMTNEEKEAHPHWETTDGYLKTITRQEAWKNLWGNLSDSDKKAFTTLPNFDAEIFFKITGIKVN